MKTIVLESPMFQKTVIVIDHIVAIQLNLENKVVSFYTTSMMSFNVPFQSEEDTITAFEESSKAIQGN